MVFAVVVIILRRLEGKQPYIKFLDFRIIVIALNFPNIIVGNKPACSVFVFLPELNQ